MNTERDTDGEQCTYFGTGEGRCQKTRQRTPITLRHCEWSVSSNVLLVVMFHQFLSSLSRPIRFPLQSCASVFTLVSRMPRAMRFIGPSVEKVHGYVGAFRVDNKTA